MQFEHFTTESYPAQQRPIARREMLQPHRSRPEAGLFQIVLHKARNLGNQPYADINYPLVETPDEWVLHGFSHPDYLKEFGPKARSEICEKSSLDLAMRDAFRKTRPVERDGSGGACGAGQEIVRRRTRAESGSPPTMQCTRIGRSRQRGELQLPAACCRRAPTPSVC